MEYTLGITESLKRIFSGVLIGGLEKMSPILEPKKQSFKICMQQFMATFTSNIFKDEYAIFYEIIVNQRSRMFSLPQLDTIIMNNKDLILDSPYVDISKWSLTSSGMQSSDDEKLEAFKDEISSLFFELSNRVISEEEFKSSCNIYISWFKNDHTLETAQNMTLILSDSGFEARESGKRRILYKGVTDAQSYYNKRIKVIRELDEENRIKSTVVDDKWYQQDLLIDQKGDSKSLLSFGIKEMDDVMGELRRGNMLGILGPPKGGKTRFSNFVVARALSLGLNVAVWALEGTQEEWISMQVACYIRMNSNFTMSSKEVIQRKFVNRTDPENRAKHQKVTLAKSVIASGLDRGRLSFIEGTAYVEDFIDILQDHYDNENQFDIIVIDSLVNILSKTRKPKTERISEAYMLTKDFVSNKLRQPALAILPAQLKQDTVDFLRKNPTETIDVTAGGESAETIRSPDEVIGLFSSKMERDLNEMNIYSVASRHGSNFEDFKVRCELGCCYFCSKSV